ncbi:beta-CASP ribonuclease aCPSF1 [Candidatus Pacearchaeota archaeon]|nr:beta-CASP ribonuclease aCPSF1 [Candidatus Pacearchaeota archaeon]
MDIIKAISEELPPKVIESANFEGANIVIYTQNKDFFLNGEDKIREVVSKIKKRVELRSSISLLVDENDAEKIIRKLIPEEAEIVNILFEKERSVVTIEVKKPGVAIGKGGETLRQIKEQTYWSAQAMRSPSIKSKITEAIRAVLHSKGEYRKNFLNKIGKRVYNEWDPGKKEEWIRLGFLGGARQVGRSCLLLQTPESKILLDCGIDISTQGPDQFPYFNIPEFDLKSIDAVIISHAHLDHSGLLPYLYKLGYRGPCYMTAPTRDISALLALDFIGVAYKKASSPLYGVVDIKTMIKHSVELNYNEVTDITPDLRLTLYNAGHTLGSAMIHLNIGNGLHNMLYTADYKFVRTRVLESAMNRFMRLETLITESTYGGKDNILPPRKDAEAQMINAVKKAIDRKGKVLVPVLGVGRAQEIMMILDNAAKEGLLPEVPIYVDGLVWDVTAIHTAYPEFLSSNLRNQIFQDKNPFTSDLFKRVGSSQERREVIGGGPCIILATSGMLVGGASQEYFRELADNKHNSIIFVSYLGPGSLGRQVQDGLSDVKLVNPESGREETMKVQMEVTTIDGMSGHAGRNEIVAFVNNMSPAPKRIIVNHGEQSRCLDLASSLYKMNKVETNVPRNLEVMRLR